MVAYAPKQDSLGDQDNIYLNLGAGSGIPNTPVTLTAGIGYNDGSLGLVSPHGQYVAWSVGASFAAGPLTLSSHYIYTRTAERLGGKAIGHTSMSRWSQYHSKQ